MGTGNTRTLEVKAGRTRRELVGFNTRDNQTLPPRNAGK